MPAGELHRRLAISTAACSSATKAWSPPAAMASERGWCRPRRCRITNCLPRCSTRSPGHYRDWIRASKGGEPACSNFSVAGPFVQWMLLGVIAMKFEGKLMWDAEKMRFTNNQEANEYLKPKFRKGWKFV